MFIITTVKKKKEKEIKAFYNKLKNNSVQVIVTKRAYKMILIREI